MFGGAGPGCNEYLGHPTQKSRPLMLWLIQKASDGLIVDPYCGVGATLLAAKQAGRKAIGIEKREEYCLKTVDRLRQGEMQFDESGHST